MTHEELLTKIDKLEILDNKSIRYATAGIKTPITADTPTNKLLAKTLRVVVELHHPNMDNNCSHCWNPGTNYLEPYPCITIQAIKKELG